MRPHAALSIQLLSAPDGLPLAEVDPEGLAALDELGLVIRGNEFDQASNPDGAHLRLTPDGRRYARRALDGV